MLHGGEAHKDHRTRLPRPVTERTPAQKEGATGLSASSFFVCTDRIRMMRGCARVVYARSSSVW